MFFHLLAPDIWDKKKTKKIRVSKPAEVDLLFKRHVTLAALLFRLGFEKPGSVPPPLSLPHALPRQERKKKKKSRVVLCRAERHPAPASLGAACD